MKGKIKTFGTLLALLSVILITPVQVSAQEGVPPEVREVNRCFEGRTQASSKLDCVFSETFITFFLIPAIIVFALTYGLTQQLDLFDEKISILIGLGLALMVMFNAEQLSFLGSTVSEMGPGPIIFILILLALVASAFKKTDKQKKKGS